MLDKAPVYRIRRSSGNGGGAGRATVADYARGCLGFEPGQEVNNMLMGVANVLVQDAVALCFHPVQPLLLVGTIDNRLALAGSTTGSPVD
ncbi:MAG: hypothetical protein H6978_01075 [Gammaproteobacteria bacterium]|nr:hypothetical protein [Gammaproteobacteria bacterium]